MITSFRSRMSRFSVFAAPEIAEERSIEVIFLLLCSNSYVDCVSRTCHVFAISLCGAVLFHCSMLEC